MADGARPYLIRASHLDGRAIEAGEDFTFNIHLFDTRPGADCLVDSLVTAVGDMMRDGIGPSRGTAGIAEVRCETKPIDLTPMRQAPSRIAVEFRTPTELKSGGMLVERPEFGVLFRRIRDRVSALQSIYGGGAPMLDYRGLGERADKIELHSCSLRQVSVTRRSSRTGLLHSLGGFVGEAQYHGGFEEFLPWLRAAEWIGVGRQTVWGKGEICVRELPVKAGTL